MCVCVHPPVCYADKHVEGIGDDEADAAQLQRQIIGGDEEEDGETQHFYVVSANNTFIPQKSQITLLRGQIPSG